jgi:ribonuclease T1
MDQRTWKRIGVALAAIVVAALVAWLGPGGGTGGETATDPSARVSTSASPTAELSDGPTDGPGDEPTAEPTRRQSGEPDPTDADDSDWEVDPESGLPWIDEADLTPEGRETLELIDAGGPFPHPGKDGSTFGNFEGLLPDHPRGYYSEYTVPTPGESDRGARRIVAGDGGELYWTVDHYESFERIRR